MKNSYNKGFTLIEVLFAIAIFSILATFILVNYRKDQDYRDLKIDTMMVYDLIKKAQTMSMANQEINGKNYSKFIVNIKDSAGSLRGDVDVIPFENLTIKKSKVIEEFDAEFSVPRGDMIINKPLRIPNFATTTIKLINIKNESLYKCIDVSTISGKIDVNNCE